MQHPIASGGLCPPDIPFQRPTSVLRPPFRKSWIRPWDVTPSIRELAIRVA